MKIQSTSNIELKKVHMAVTGYSGSGKTYLASTIKGKPLVLNADKGLLSLKGYKISYVSATKWQDVIDFMKFITNEAQMKKHGYTCVVIDSLSAIEKMLRDHLDDKGVDGFGKWDAYEKNIGGIMQTLRDSETFDSLTIFEVEEKENSNGLLEKKFALKGSLRSKIPYFYDFVFVTKKIEGKKDTPAQYVLQTCQKGGWDFVKSRGVVLKDYEPANINHILKKLKESK